MYRMESEKNNLEFVIPEDTASVSITKAPVISNCPSGSPHMTASTNILLPPPAGIPILSTQQTLQQLRTTQINIHGVPNTTNGQYVHSHMNSIHSASVVSSSSVARSVGYLHQPSLMQVSSGVSGQDEPCLSDEEARKRREYLERRPSYRQILSDLSGAEMDVKKEHSINPGAAFGGSTTSVLGLGITNPNNTLYHSISRGSGFNTVTGGGIMPATQLVSNAGHRLMLSPQHQKSKSRLSSANATNENTICPEPHQQQSFVASSTQSHLTTQPHLMLTKAMDFRGLSNGSNSTLDQSVAMSSTNPTQLHTHHDAQHNSQESHEIPPSAQIITINAPAPSLLSLYGGNNGTKPESLISACSTVASTSIGPSLNPTALSPSSISSKLPQNPADSLFRSLTASAMAASTAFPSNHAVLSHEQPTQNHQQQQHQTMTIQPHQLFQSPLSLGDNPLNSSLAVPTSSSCSTALPAHLHNRVLTGIPVGPSEQLLNDTYDAVGTRNRMATNIAAIANAAASLVATNQTSHSPINTTINPMLPLNAVPNQQSPNNHSSGISLPGGAMGQAGIVGSNSSGLFGINGPHLLNGAGFINCMPRGTTAPMDVGNSASTGTGNNTNSLNNYLTLTLNNSLGHTRGPASDGCGTVASGVNMGLLSTSGTPNGTNESGGGAMLSLLNPGATAAALFVDMSAMSSAGGMSGLGAGARPAPSSSVGSAGGDGDESLSPGLDGMDGGGGSLISPSNSASGLSVLDGASGQTGGDGNVSVEARRKRELRLLKNREAAKECRRKKKEYVRCLENRVAVLEKQNKALIEELKTLKELYCRKADG